MDYALSHGDVATLAELLDEGRSVDERNVADASLLHRAVGACSLDAAKLLLERGAQVNATDDKGMTALHWVCEGFGGWCSGETLPVELARLLIANGANVNAKDANAMTQLKLAQGSGSKPLAKLLREHGAR